MNPGMTHLPGSTPSPMVKDAANRSNRHSIPNNSAYRIFTPTSPPCSTSCLYISTIGALHRLYHGDSEHPHEYPYTHRANKSYERTEKILADLRAGVAARNAPDLVDNNTDDDIKIDSARTMTFRRILKDNDWAWDDLTKAYNRQRGFNIRGFQSLHRA
ncbi:serine threonine-protein kinase rio1 [Colletotrichum sojae]|uniref:Serine threonine-protein kinase rio1 n=1 Tax=Colletotrichum sojae TaxID=2175907 RepID=A0A8H6JF70_9PEZI|nr:serine threonine-protein kinase rio1 [Colletotrichum sojae]